MPVPEEPTLPASEWPAGDKTSRACANCGTVLHGAFCAACGQKAEPLRQSVGHFLKASLIEFIGVDGRLWQTLGLLLFRPGRLTRAFLQGHRVRYIRPLRLYLVASLSFFFLLSLSDPVARMELTGDEVRADTTLRVADYRASIDTSLAETAARIAAQVALVDSLDAAYRTDSTAFAADSAGLAADSTLADSLDEREEDLEDLLDERDDEQGDLRRLRERMADERRRLEWKREQIATAPPDSLVRPADLERAATLLFDESAGERMNINMPDWLPRSEALQRMQESRTDAEFLSALGAFFRDALRRLPTVIFLLLPGFALLLKLIYIRRGWYYSEHLVFGLHTHAFAFLVYTAMIVLVWASEGAGWANVTTNVLALLIPLYFYVAQKRVYGQGWLKTAVKALMLGFTYTVLLLGFGLTLTLVLAAAFG